MTNLLVEVDEQPVSVQDYALPSIAPSFGSRHCQRLFKRVAPSQIFNCRPLNSFVPRSWHHPIGFLVSDEDLGNFHIIVAQVTVVLFPTTSRVAADHVAR